MRLVLTQALYDIACMRAAGLRTCEIVRRTGKHRGTIHKQVTQLNKRLGRDRVQIALALQDCLVASQRKRKSGYGFLPGDVVRVTGGRLAGRVGTYVKTKNSTQAMIQVNGAVLQPQLKHLELVGEKTHE